jgi:hypothetical protein
MQRRSTHRPVSLVASVCVGLALGFALSTCSIAELDLAGKACPCAEGWTCDPSRQVCVQGPLSGGGAGGGGGQAGNEPDASTDADAAPDGGCTFVPEVSPGLEGPRGYPSCESGTDEDCDGFTDADDADCSTTYTIIRAATPPTLDGDCSEYAAAQSLTLRTDASNHIVFWLMWDETALYLCADVADSSLDAAQTDPVADQDGPLWADDALELYFDVDHDAGPSLDVGDYKLFVNVYNVHEDSEAGDPAWNIDFDSAVQVDGTPNQDGDTDHGFSAELVVPWANWGVAVPAPSTVWGGDLMWDDRDSVTDNEQHARVWAQTLGNENFPDGFGDFVFVE